MGYVLAHGGTTSKRIDVLGTRKAAHAGLKALPQGALAAVVEACRVMEDNPRLHAGTGSTYKFDGKTLEMDAGVCCSDGRYGAVGAIAKVRNPVLVARALADLPSNLLVGDGATAFARRLGMPEHDVGTAKARKEWRHLIDQIRKGKAGPDENEWDAARLRQHWNFATPFEEVFPDGFPPPEKAGDAEPKGGKETGGDARRGGGAGSGDTVGAVAFDGDTFAAAASTSGMTCALRGRAGDSIVLGGGILATEHGGVACSGNGDHVLRRRLATLVGGWLADGLSPESAARRAVALFPRNVDAAVVVGGREGHFALGNRFFAHSVAEE